MPTKTTASQNKKTNQADLQQKSKSSKKNYSRKNTKSYKTGDKNIKKKQKSLNVLMTAKETTKPEMVKQPVLREDTEQKSIDNQKTTVSVDEVTKENENSIWDVVLLFVCLIMLIGGITYSQWAETLTESVKELKTVVVSKTETFSEKTTQSNQKETIDENDGEKIKKSIPTEDLKETDLKKENVVSVDKNKEDNANEYEQGQSEVEDVLAKILADKSFPVLGNPNGQFVIVDFFDYSCHWCRKTNYLLDKYIADGKAPNIRVIAVPTPVMGDQSIGLASYVLASMKQNKFQEFHSALTRFGMTLSRENLIKIAETIGLDIEQLDKDVADIETANQLERNIALFEQLKAQGIPYLIVNGKLKAGALHEEELEFFVEESNKIH